MSQSLLIFQFHINENQSWLRRYIDLPHKPDGFTEFPAAFLQQASCVYKASHC